MPVNPHQGMHADLAKNPNRAHIRIRIQVPWKLIAKLKNSIAIIADYRSRVVANMPPVVRRNARRRISWALLSLIMTLGVFMDAYNLRQATFDYKLSSKAKHLLITAAPKYAPFIAFNTADQTYDYNRGYKASDGVKGLSATPRFTATFNANPDKGVTITEPSQNIPITFKPLFAMARPTKDQNRLVYPIKGMRAVKVYTLQAVSLKEDIVLRSYQGDTLSFSYKLELADGTEARLEPNGSLGVYGTSSALLGNVTTATQKDADLLNLARKNGRKTNLLFTFPAPFVKEYGKDKSNASSWFTLNNNILTVHSKDLKGATYPLSIDPSIYIDTAAKLMKGNNESNVDFDVTNELIQKSQTTGARIDSWTATSDLNAAVWDQATAVAGGYIYSVGGLGGNELHSQVFSTQGAGSFSIPAGVTSVTVKAWGGGGGGGGGGRNGGTGAPGGGGGYTEATYSVSGGSLDVYVGGGGAGGAYSSAGNDAGGGGGGGGYSSVYYSGTPVVIAAGGGGGGGARDSTNGGDGGAGGGTTGDNGTSVGNGHGGGGGTSVSGGSGGTGGNNNGSAGSSLSGGNGADGRSSQGTDGTGVAGGGASGGNGGRANVNTTRPGGGGGGAGYFGGGGGGSTTSALGNAGGGGGGGSSYIDSGASSPTNSIGSGIDPGNATDSSRNGAGSGGTGGASLGAGSDGANGLVIVQYTVAGNTAISSSVSWAKFNPSSGTIDSPNPGNGACSGWCSNAAYNLPAVRRGLSLVAYNGFLYAMGGVSSSGCTGTSHTCNTVYIAKIGANGEPQLWHPTDTNPNNWVYWYTSTNNLSSERAYTAAYAYNNRLYLLGGKTDSTAGVSTVEYTDFKPTGDIGSWSSTGMSSLPGVSGRYGHTVQAYNDTLYLVGGRNASGTFLNDVWYVHLNSDGTMNSWVHTSDFSTGRMTYGGSYTALWGGYIYIGGGCTALSGNYCSGIASDVQLASINADGSLSEWNTILNLSNQRIGYTFIAWQNGLYRLGGCGVQNLSTGDCDDAYFNVDYGVINQEGEASTVADSVPSGSSPCAGGTPFNCDLPGVSIVGDVLSGSAILNSYLYIWGGCSNTTSGCGSVSRGVIYTSIGSDGSLTKPSSCGSWSTADSYCYNTTSLPTGGVGAPGVAVFNGRIYSVGGFTSAGSVGQVYYAEPSASDGSISSWSSASITGIGAENVSYAYSFARANPASVSSTPGNLYILGGCGSPAGIGCSSYTGGVYKCTISTAGAPAACSQNPGGSNQQLQIGAVTDGLGHSAGTGLGAMVGTVYANYIYLAGGLSSDPTYGLDLKVTRYAKIDNNNNIVAVSGGAWIEDTDSLMQFGRRRGSGFGYNGYLYVVGGYDGSGGGILADIEFAKIDVSNGSLGVFHVSSVNINQRWGLTMAVSNSYAYVIGGCITGNAPTCSAGGQTDSIQTFQIYNNDSGAVKTFTAASDDTFAASANRTGARSVVYNGYIYVAGGCINTCSVVSDFIFDIEYASISASDGSIGSWSSTSSSLNKSRAWGYVTVIANTLYYVGGEGDDGGGTYSTKSSAEYATIDSNGDITNAFNVTSGSGTGSLPNSRSMFGGATWNNRIYVIGGKTGVSPGSTRANVYYSSDLSGGGSPTSWTSTTSIPIAKWQVAATAYANNLYVFGGDNGTDYFNDSQFAQINSDGSIGSWAYTTSLPAPISGGTAFAANGYMYIVNGRSAASTCTPKTIVAPISANTTIASGNNPTGVGEWFETNVKYTGDRYGAAVAYNQGKFYMMGGGCSTPLTSGRHFYAVLKSQPQIAKYSRMIDADTDVFPNSWLMNGLDNSIGARWQGRYRSSTAANNSWGQETNYGNISLGDVAPYTPLDGSGSSTNFARYYYFSISIDASQTFGYPEDVTRGPTIYDLSLFFTADPSKRLMHGRTFTGGVQQPLDTPCHQTVDPDCPLP